MPGALRPSELLLLRLAVDGVVVDGVSTIITVHAMAVVSHCPACGGCTAVISGWFWICRSAAGWSG